MGTRNLTMVISNGETKVAQYGQWDGYPEGQGATALKFLTNNDLVKFKHKLNSVFFVNDRKQKEIDSWLLSMGCENGWMNGEQADKYKSKYPLLSRDNGADILQMIMESEEEINWVTDSSEFAGDSLFCEWAYVVDLDKNVFEVYQGFNNKPLTIEDRFYYLTAEADKENQRRKDYGSDSMYYPIKMIKSYNLNDLPLEAEFINHFKQEQDA
jgi:hypothetical protein